ncbi:MAG: GtrA family protein [Frankiaceae bacterium]|nr:GtrA family protein [Frankiaceae bacterium]MBV9369861.1 GtrA family protein [Frankiales bacterium]
MASAQLLRQRLAVELAAFGVIGAVCLVADIVLFNVFTFGAGLSPVAAKSVGMVITGTMAFFGHRHVTFRHHRGDQSYRREVTMFVVATLLTVLLSLLPLFVAKNVIHTHDVVLLNGANLLGIALGTLARYLAYRHVVWAAAPTGPDAGTGIDPELLGSGPSGSGRAAAGLDQGVAGEDARPSGLLELEHELVGEQRRP